MWRRSIPPIYLDHAATSVVDQRVADLVLRMMREEYGNAGSRTHVYGTHAAASVRAARTQIARRLACEPEEIVFTSGATESSNLAILGAARAPAAKERRHIVTTAIEHSAVEGPIAALEREGFAVTRVKPVTGGRIDASEVLDAVRPDTLLVSVMHANNETGVVQPITAVAGGLAEDGPLLHIDAAQTFGRLDHELSDPRLDLISISGHKINAPKGVGALLVRARRGRGAIAPIMYGGGQERGLRPGTVPVPLVCGLGLAAELAGEEQAARRSACLAIRKEALGPLVTVGGLVHGEAEHTLPHILSIAFPGVDSEALIVALKDVVAISNGSACTSASYQPSHVLVAMGLETALLESTVRISWSHETGPVPWERVAAVVRMLS